MALSVAVKRVIQTGLDLGIPDAVRTSEWAEAYRHVDRGARKGRWSNDVTPYLIEIMDCDDDPAVREVVFMKPSQIGGSEVVVNVIGKRIHLAPTEIIYCAEKEDKAKAWTQESFDATVRSTPVLKSLIYQGDSDNNQKVKRFNGGGLYIVWATSPAELSSRPAELLIFDEKAGFKPTSEGDAVTLGQARQKTYSDSAKTFLISSPRNADDDNDISHDYERGDRREYWVPCPACDEMQTLKFGGVGVAHGLKWDDDEPETTYYLCEHNGCMIEYDDLGDMLLRGRWIASEPFNGVASFKISQVYSPFVPWSDMVRDFLKAKKFKSTLQAWTNTQLGEAWRPEERIDYADLTLNRESYAATVPQGVLILTAGVDVQGDRLECEIVGWGRDHESWSIDYRIFHGDPSGLDVWDELADYLTGSFEGETGTFSVNAACIDSGGHHTQQVYKFCKANAGRRWHAIKGSSQPGNPLVSKPKWVGKNPKVKLFSIGTDTAKDEIFGFLQITEPGPGYCHFPDDERYDEAYLKQLCSEKKMPRFRMGRQYYIYEKVSVNARNEALDVRVYATAARAILNPAYEKIAARRIALPEVADRLSEPSVVTDGQPEPPEPTTPEGRRKRFNVIKPAWAEGYKL